MATAESTVRGEKITPVQGLYPKPFSGTHPKSTQKAYYIKSLTPRIPTHTFCPQNYPIRPRTHLEGADACVEATFRIIEHLRPDAWFVENPASGMMRTRPCMQRFAACANMTSYCRWGFPYRKHTCIWSNIPLELPACTRSTPCDHVRANVHHAAVAQTGTAMIHGLRIYGRPTEELWKVPNELVHSLCRQATQNILLHV